MALLSHDDVLNVFHSEVVTKRVIKQSLELVHGQFLHVALETQTFSVKHNKAMKASIM